MIFSIFYKELTPLEAAKKAERERLNEKFPYLRHLPMFFITRAPIRTREQSAESDVIYNVQSLDDVLAELSRRGILSRR